MFDEFLNKYIITGNIRTTTGVYIGGNTNVFEPHDVDNILLKDVNGLPFIPGSSLKGVLRSYLEKILKGIGKDVCSVPNLCSDKFKNKEARNNILAEIKKENKDNAERNELKLVSENIYNELCEVCHLFGSGVSAAKLLIRDLKVIESSFKGYEVRSGNAIDRDKNKTIKGALYTMEIIPSDTLFDMKMILENPDETDLRNTAFLLRSMEEGDIAIGGNVSRGLGGFVLENCKIQHINKDNIMNSFIDGQKEYVKIDDLMNINEEEV